MFCALFGSTSRVKEKKEFWCLEANKDSHDGLGVFGEEVLRAARSFASLEWRVIRDERFHVTPVGAQQTVNGYVLFACVCRTCMVSCKPRSLMSSAASETNC